MLVVLRVGRRVKVVVVVVRRRVLWDLAVLGMVTLVLGRHSMCLCCVVEVGWVGLVGYEGGLTGLRVRGVALGWWFASLAAEKRPEDGSRC